MPVRVFVLEMACERIVLQILNSQAYMILLVFFFFFISTHTDPFIRDHAGVLPLHLAASAGMVNALRLLIKSTVTVGRVPWWKNGQVCVFLKKITDKICQ